MIAFLLLVYYESLSNTIIIIKDLTLLIEYQFLQWFYLPYLDTRLGILYQKKTLIILGYTL